jgi:serine phosphatase RsbU (regulator of sigma subunit)
LKKYQGIAIQLFRIFVFFQLLILVNPVLAQNEKTEKVEYYLNQFSYYEYMSWDTAKWYLDSAVEQASGSRDPMVLGKVDLYQGWYFQDISEFDSSRTFFFYALDHFTRANSYNKIADTYGNIGNAFLDVGDLKSSLEYQLKSLETNEQIIILSKDNSAIEAAIRGRAYAWSNLSNIYKVLGEYEEALKYEIQAMHYELGNSDSIGLGISYINMGASYKHLDEIDSSFLYITKAHGIFKRHSYANGFINSNIFLYEHSVLMGDPQLDYLLDAYDVTREFEDRHSEVYVLGYLIEGDFGFSKDSLDRMTKRANQLVEENELSRSLFRIFEQEATNHARWGDFHLAYQSLRIYLEHFSVKKTKIKGVDFENATLRHEFQMQSLQDSISFEKTLNKNKLENEKRVSRQRNVMMISIFGGVIMAIFLFFVYRSLKVKKETNRQLNESNQLIESQKELVEEKNKEITDSISYAKRLQKAILPTVGMIQEEFSDSFVLYLPKDVVSGDFYWFEKKQGLTFVAVADCTGHGVPGAMVSVVCSNALNRSVNEFNLSLTNEILDKTRELVIDTFAKSGEDVKDGMDICICAFDLEKKTIQYSGANNPLWIIRENEFLREEDKQAKSTVLGNKMSLIEIKPSKQPVGLYEGMKGFEAHSMSFYGKDEFILFTDGYADQFGGEKGKKLKYKNLKQLLLDNSNKAGEKQKIRLEEFMNDWIRDLEQVDDICIIGIRMQ